MSGRCSISSGIEGLFGACIYGRDGDTPHGTVTGLSLIHQLQWQQRAACRPFPASSFGLKSGQLFVLRNRGYSL
jgi:hypothetical protein